MLRALAAAVLVAALPAAAAVSPAAPAARDDTATYQHLIDAAGAVVDVKVQAIPGARSNRILGAERSGSGVVIGPALVLTIGYLIVEADTVVVTTARGHSTVATVAAYDHATGFGLLRTVAPLDVKPVKLGSSASVGELDRLMFASADGADGVSVATVVSKRQFAGYWEYLIDGAIFTTPPRIDHSGAALIDKSGELVGIGSLVVMNAAAEDERLPGNMFVPIDLLKPILDEMIATGRQKAGLRPWLGLSSVEEDGRIKVMRVSEGGPADEAGIVEGDVILAMGGEKVEHLNDFYRRLWSSGAPGVEVMLKVMHGATIRDVRVHSIDRLDFIKKRPAI